MLYVPVCMERKRYEQINSLFSFYKPPQLHTALEGCLVNGSTRVMNKNYDRKAATVRRWHFTC